MTDRVQETYIPAPVTCADAFRVTAALRAKGYLASNPDPVRDSLGRLVGYSVKWLP